MKKTSEKYWNSRWFWTKTEWKICVWVSGKCRRMMTWRGFYEDSEWNTLFSHFQLVSVFLRNFRSQLESWFFCVIVTQVFCAVGEIGKRSGFRFQRRKACGFKSRTAHHFQPQKSQNCPVLPHLIRVLCAFECYQMRILFFSNRGSECQEKRRSHRWN